MLQLREIPQARWDAQQAQAAVFRRPAGFVAEALRNGSYYHGTFISRLRSVRAYMHQPGSLFLKTLNGSLVVSSFVFLLFKTNSTGHQYDDTANRPAAVGIHRTPQARSLR
jgi:hypothetical protein